jgi:hypothetical protein
MYAVHLIVLVYHEKVSLGARAMVLDVIHSDKSTLYLGPEHKPLSTVRVKIGWQTAERIAIFIPRIPERWIHWADLQRPWYCAILMQLLMESMIVVMK